MKESLLECSGLSNFSLYNYCRSFSAVVQSAPEDPKAAELASELDRLNRALVKVEKEILSRLRAPLDNRNPTQDLENRLQEHEVKKKGEKLFTGELMKFNLISYVKVNISVLN